MVEAGVYLTTLADGFHGFMLVTADGISIFASEHVGVGTWSYPSNTTAHLDLTGPLLNVDDSQVASFSANGAIAVRTLDVMQDGADLWTGGGAQMEKLSRPAPDNFGLNLAWAQGRPYNVDGVRIEYRLDLGTDGAGNIAGSDTEGCLYEGKVARAPDSDELYTVSLTLSDCPDSAFFAQNGEYSGLGYIAGTGTSINDPYTFSITLIRADNTAGLDLGLSEIFQ